MENPNKQVIYEEEGLNMRSTPNVSDVLKPVYGDDLIRAYEVQRKLIDGVWFDLEAAEVFEINYRNGAGQVQVQLEFERRFEGEVICPGLTEDTLAAILYRRLESQLGKRDTVETSQILALKSALAIFLNDRRS